MKSMNGLRSGMVVALVMVSSFVLAQSSGRIDTRPTDFPGGVQVNYSTQYVEGPTPIRLDNGDVVILVNVGTGSGEGIAALSYPADASVNPRWYPIYATNNWGTDPGRQEHEAAFPTAVYFNGMWRLFYTATTLQGPQGVGVQNRDREGRIDLVAPTAQPSSITPFWLPPIDPECGSFGTCNDRGGSGFADSVIGADGNLYLYHRDPHTQVPSPSRSWICDSGVVRHRVNADMSFAYAGCLVFPQDGAAPGQSGPGSIFDVARGSDGAYYMLKGSGAFPSSFQEYRSTDGLTWRYNHRDWSSGLPGFSADGAYLRDKTGRIVEPRVIVGITGASGYSYGTGDWYLHYWSDLGAVLPPRWGSAAVTAPPPDILPGGAPDFQGEYSVSNCDRVSGWAWDWYRPNVAISVDIYDGATFLGQVVADQTSSKPGLGNGRHDFSYFLPASVRNGATHSIAVRFVESSGLLTNVGPPGTCNPGFQGFFDSASCDVIAGWAWDPRQPNTPISVSIVDGTTPIATISANLFRQDLLNAGIGNGAHGFSFSAPAGLRNGWEHPITVRYSGTTTALPASPRSVLCGTLLAPSALNFSREAASLEWGEPPNLSPLDRVTYDVIVTGGTCPTGGCIHHTPNHWYTFGCEVGPGDYQWTVKANSTYRPSSPAVVGPPFTISGRLPLPRVAAPPATSGDRLWLDEGLPAGAIAAGQWIWDTSQSASGAQSNTEASASGTHQHYFYGATQTFFVAPGDKLVCYVLLDPCDPPRELMLQWNDGTWEHRAFWGQDLIAWGASGTASRLPMGALPPGGQWIRLEVPAASLGLTRSTLNGMAFTLHGGKAWFDRAGAATGPPLDDACFGGQTPPPSSMPAGSSATVSITMRNCGNTTWTDQYRLGSQNPQDNQTWGVGRVFLAPGESVTPGQLKPFVFNITAPTSLGSYNFQWRMVHEAVRWFGALTPNLTVTVVHRVLPPQIGGLCCPVKHGPTTGGTIVVITGSNFVAGAKAYFGGVLAQSTTVDNASQITTVTPPHPAGVVDIVVTNPDGQSATLPGGFTFSGPSVSSIAPASGPMAGGTPVTITGMDFGSGASVSIGGAAATAVTVVNATTITAVTSAHACGTFNVVVANTDGQSGTLANGFFYTSPQPPTGLSPNGTTFPSATTSVTLSWAAVSGATQYAVRVQDNTDGTIQDPRNNCGTNTIYVCVGPVPATTFSVSVQAGHSYTWWVHAGSACGQYSAQTNGSFSVAGVYPAPTVAAINPPNGPMAGGTAVTISGTGFRVGAGVSIGGAAATGVSVVGATTITATTAARACGTVDVVVTNTDGKSGILASGFFYTSPQPPTGLSPNGTTLPSTTTSVTLSWAAVSGATQYAVRVQDLTDGTIRDPRNNCGTNTIYLCVGPVPTTTYSVPVQPGHSYTWWVHAGSACGQYSVQTNGSFSVAAALPAPTPTAINPASGPMAGGTAVTISGTGFRVGAGVSIGGAAATGVTVVSATSISATTSAHACGTFNVVVTNPDGQSGTLTNAFFYSSPQPPTGLSPNGTTLPGTTTSVTLSWAAVSGATQYAVRVQDNTDGTIRDPRNNCGTNTIYVCVGPVPTTTYSVPVQAGHSYTWWVHAGSACGQYSSQTYASFSVAVDPLHAPTGLAKEASPSRNLVWTPPNNLTGADSVTYNLWITGGSNCAGGCLYHPAAPSWYTMGTEISTGSYTWSLQAVSASRPYSAPVNGPAFTMP